jgi:hypothetical protein
MNVCRYQAMMRTPCRDLELLVGAIDDPVVRPASDCHAGPAVLPRWYGMARTAAVPPSRDGTTRNVPRSVPSFRYGLTTLSRNVSPFRVFRFFDARNTPRLSKKRMTSRTRPARPDRARRRPPGRSRRLRADRSRVGVDIRARHTGGRGGRHSRTVPSPPRRPGLPLVRLGMDGQLGNGLACHRPAPERTCTGTPSRADPYAPPRRAGATRPGWPRVSGTASSAIVSYRPGPNGS